MRDQLKPQYPLHHMPLYLVGSEVGLKESSTTKWITRSHQALSHPAWKRVYPPLPIFFNKCVGEGETLTPKQEKKKKSALLSQDSHREKGEASVPAGLASNSTEMSL